MNKELQRILYVEDEADIRRVVKLALESLGGLTVIACASGEEALAMAPGAVIDLILLDVMMPVLDGPNTLRCLREHASMANTPVIFMTAKVQPDEIEFFKSLGALEVISKPFDALTLADTLRTIWQRAIPPQSPVVSSAPDSSGSMSAAIDSAAEANFLARMAQLQRQFERELPERLQELQSEWSGLNAQWNRAALEAIHVSAHNLAGCGATFGYEAITDKARAFDARLKLLIKQHEAPDEDQWRELVAQFVALEAELQGVLAAL